MEGGAGGGGGEEERKDIPWSSNDLGTMTFLRTDDINRLARELDKEHEKTVLSARSATSDSFDGSFLCVLCLRRIPRKRVKGGKEERPPCKIHRDNKAERSVFFCGRKIHI